jgi:hypothetical protein
MRTSFDLLIPHDLAKPGGMRESTSSGFTILAEDEKGSLVRLDQNFSGNSFAVKDTVFYAARSRGANSLLVIRIANQDDRMKRFRRPKYLDHLTMSCCNLPAKYMSIYDQGSGQFFDLDVLPDEAIASAEGKLLYFFVCNQCGQQQALPVEV